MKTASHKPIPPIEPLGNGRYYIHFGIEQTEDCDGMTAYTAETVKLDAEPTYAAIVSALIAQRYSRDEMEAVINNYLLDPDDPEAKAEFDVMQAWRAEAKRIAREALSQHLTLNA